MTVQSSRSLSESAVRTARRDPAPDSPKAPRARPSLSTHPSSGRAAALSAAAQIRDLRRCDTSDPVSAVQRNALHRARDDGQRWLAGLVHTLGGGHPGHVRAVVGILQKKLITPAPPAPSPPPSGAP